jgi:hypothetical protein
MSSQTIQTIFGRVVAGLTCAKRLEKERKQQRISSVFRFIDLFLAMKFVHYFLVFNVFILICALAFIYLFNRQPADRMNFVLTRFTYFSGFMKERTPRKSPAKNWVLKKVLIF